MEEAEKQYNRDKEAALREQSNKEIAEREKAEGTEGLGWRRPSVERGCPTFQTC